MTPGKLFAAFGVGAVLLFVAFIAIITIESRNAPEIDCATVQVRPGEWRDAAPPDRVVLYNRYTACDRLRGLTREQALAAFGPPDRERPGALAWRFVPDRPTFNGPELFFGADGRVTDVRRARS